MALNTDDFLSTVQRVHTHNPCVSWDIGLITNKSKRTLFTFLFFSNRRGYYASLEIW